MIATAAANSVAEDQPDADEQALLSLCKASGDPLRLMILRVLRNDSYGASELAQLFVDKHHALFLGRGSHYPIAMEGALKLKEISYIHAEAYAAGELKHGPLALVDEDMPVVTVAPDDELLEKLKSNLQEVRARGGELYVFADPRVQFGDRVGIHTMPMKLA